MRYTGRYDVKYTAAEKADHQAAALELTPSARGADGLTKKERQLIQAIKALGYEIASAHGWPRYIGKAA